MWSYSHMHLSICDSMTNNGSERSNNKLYIHVRESPLLVEYEGTKRRGDREKEKNTER